MREVEESLINLMRQDQKWESIFTFIVEIGECSRRQELLRDYFEEFINFVEDLEEEDK